jgi:hypothetical protein
LIYTMRFCQVDRQHHEEFRRLSEEGVWLRQPRVGNRALGLWVVVMGGPERLVLMTRYESLAHWQETRRWGGRRAEESGGDSPGARRNLLVRDYEVIALRPLSRRQPLEDGPEGEPGIYTLRTFRVAREARERFVQLAEESVWPWVERGKGCRPVGMWLSYVAPEERIYVLTRFDGLEHWERTLGISPPPEDAALRPLWERYAAASEILSGLAAESSIKVLRPLSRRMP